MLKFIDTHIHFWNPSVLNYPWLATEEWKHLADTFEPTDFEKIADNVVGTVHVQAEVDHADDPVSETAWLDSFRRNTHPARPVPTVVVGYADLTQRDLPDVLDRHQAYDYFRGVRQEAWYDAASAERGLEHDVDLLQHPDWVNGLAELARRDLTFDLLVYAHQLRAAADIFASVPDLRVVVDHLGHPASAIDNGTWQDDLRYFKERVPNAFVKLSGFSFVAPNLKDEAIRNRTLETLDIFGPERCMAASNYPVDKTLGSYADIWSTFDQITADLGEPDRSKIFIHSAVDFYGLEMPQQVSAEAELTNGKCATKQGS